MQNIHLTLYLSDEVFICYKMLMEKEKWLKNLKEGLGKNKNWRMNMI